MVLTEREKTKKKRPVLGKLLFKSNCLQLLVTDVKKVIIYFTFYKISKVTCGNYNYFSKVKKLLLCYCVVCRV